MHSPFLLTAITLLSTTLAAPSSSLKPRSSGWTIRDFRRDCADNGKFGFTQCVYVLTVDTSEVLQQCSIFDLSDDAGTPAATGAFYNVPCSENPDYHISWGWDYQNDFTVMTVVYVPTQMEAFFGYNHPNANLPSTTYPDVGPNAVQSTGVHP